MMHRSYLHILFVLTCLVFIALHIGTLHFYGVPFDEAQGESFLGDRYFAFLTSWDTKHLDFNTPTLSIYDRPDHPDYFANRDYAVRHAHHIWGLGHTLASATKWLFYTKLGLLGPIDAQHAAIGFCSLLLFIGIYLFSARWLTPLTGLLAVLLLMTHPRFWAYSHYNIKDIPEAVFYSLTLLTFAHGIYSQNKKWLIITSLLWGVSLAIKANALFLPLTAFPFLLLAIHELPAGERLKAFYRNMLAFFPLAALSFVVLLILWPYLLKDFPDGLIMHLRFLNERGLEGPPHWNIYPLLNGIYTTPIPTLIAAFVGALALIFHSFKTESRSIRRSLVVMLFLWCTLPVLRVSIPYARDFDVIRHWIEFLPALCLIAAFGAQQIIILLKRSLPLNLSFVCSPIICALLVLPSIFWSVKNNPYQYVYYNSLIGGLGGAQQKNMPESCDYWAVSYREAINWLNEHAEKDSTLYVAFAEHTVFYSKLWLRPDISLRSISKLTPEILRSNDTGLPTRYLLYTPRKRHMPVWLRSFPIKELEKLYAIQIDNGLVVSIYKHGTYEQ